MIFNNDISIQLLKRNNQIQKKIIKIFKKKILFFFEIFNRDKKRNFFINIILISKIEIQFSRCNFVFIKILFENFVILNKFFSFFFFEKIIFFNIIDKKQFFDNNIFKFFFFDFDQFEFFNSK